MKKKRRGKWNISTAERQRRYRKRLRERKQTFKEELEMQRITHETSIDLFALTAFVVYWRKKERDTKQMLMPQTYSELIRVGFEGYVEGLLTKYPEVREQIERFTLGDCLIVLRDCGFKAPERERYKRSMKRALEGESLQTEFNITREEYVAEDHKEKYQFTEEDKERAKEDLEVLREFVEGKRPDPEEEKRKALKSLESVRSSKEQGISFEEKEARKKAELKKGLDEGPDPSTIINTKGGE